MINIYSKEQQLKSNRIKPKQRNRTRITQKVRKEVERRSEGECERCGKSRSFAFEMAHLNSAGQLGSGSDPSNVVLLCGPKVNSGTCHNFADETSAGRHWKMKKKAELEQYYSNL